MTTIIPSLDPRRGGVAAYGLELARHYPRGLGGARFIALDVPATMPKGLVHANVAVVARESGTLAGCLERHAEARALVHYVGYGYARDACPGWLLDGLTVWKRNEAGRRLDIFFHELATDENWWVPTFWTQARQRRIIGGLCRLADRVATSCPQFHRQLREDYRVELPRLALAPIPPTLVRSDMSGNRVPKQRGLTALVFGLEGTRRRTLGEHAVLLRCALRTGLLSRVLIAGTGATPGEAEELRRENGEILAWPDIDERQMTALAALADFGLVWNWPSILTKSTVFANLCVAGVPAIVGQRRGEGEAGLPIRQPFIECDGSSASVQHALKQLADPEKLAQLRENGQRLASGYLGWPAIAATLNRHFEL